jgi:sigma-B regulation protein RsbU (phosphoserine phosphatase)
MNYHPAYRELVDYLVTPYFEATVSGEIVLVNKALQEVAGDVRGRRIWELFAGRFEAPLRALCEAAPAVGQKRVMEMTLAGPGGAPVLLELSAVQFAPVHEAVGLRGKVKCIGDDEFHENELALKRQAEELAFLNHLAEVISSSLDLDDILYSICRESQRVFDARNVGIALLNEKKDGLRVVSFFSDQPGESDTTGLEFSLEGNDASLFVIKTGEPIVVPDAQANPITRSIHGVMKQRGTTCLMVIPLLARGEVIGTIGMPSASQQTFSRNDVRLAMTIASQVASVIDNARLHQSVKRQRDIAERELEIGHQIQTFFFPDAIPDLDGWNISAYSELARQVGGDFYDVFALGENDRVGIVLADVCDKGVGAALFMVLFRSLLREQIQNGFRTRSAAGDIGRVLVEAVGNTNNYIAGNHARAHMFATVFVAVIGTSGGGCWYLNCGHDAPVLRRKTGVGERLRPTGPAIGMFPDLELSPSYISMSPGDSVIAFTDGVTDACSVEGFAFGEERVVEICRGGGDMRKRLTSLKNALYHYIDGAEPVDDITWVGFERTGTNVHLV